jgi:hypothetical protein
VEGDENLVSLATKYCKELFGPSTCYNIPLNLDLWGVEEKVAVNENDSLCKPFSESEVKLALFQMEHNKAAGPDKIPMEFYQACWDIIKSVIMELFNDLYMGKLDVSKINYGVISLLPKVVDADKMHQSICLLNCLYKWITKVLTIRLTPIAGRLICAEQTTFIKGRNIMNGVMVLHEVMHETKKRKETGSILKLDFEKAYDKVSWKFLLECLKLRGFNEKWCEWVNHMLTGGTVYVKINDHLGPYFMSHKGVRQGDPLSPILFNFVADCLTKLVKQAQVNGLFTGLAANLIPKGIAILQYADDTIICLKNDMAGAKNMKILLYMYEQMAGLKINFAKSEVLTINGCEELEIQYAEIFNYQTGSFPIKYLGVPVSPSRLHVIHWEPLKEKNRKKLEIWKGGTMSIAGRTIMINSSLSSSFIYHMSMYLFPKAITKELDKQRRTFFWQGGVKKENTTWSGGK